MNKALIYSGVGLLILGAAAWYSWTKGILSFGGLIDQVNGSTASQPASPLSDDDERENKAAAATPPPRTGSSTGIDKKPEKMPRKIKKYKAPLPISPLGEKINYSDEPQELRASDLGRVNFDEVPTISKKLPNPSFRSSFR